MDPRGVKRVCNKNIKRKWIYFKFYLLINFKNNLFLLLMLQHIGCYKIEYNFYVDVENLFGYNLCKVDCAPSFRQPKGWSGTVGKCMFNEILNKVIVYLLYFV